jgi:DUF1707 SHOCT-like domain
MSSTPTGPVRPGGSAARTRASDAEREEIAQIVRDAVGEGRLDISEGDERLATVYAAKYRDELNPIVTDLPAGQARQARAAGAVEPGTDRGPWGHGGWGHSAWGRGGSAQRHGEGRPEGEDLRRRRGRFGGHLALVVLVSAALIGVWSLTGASFFWPAIPLIFLSMGLVRHWRWAAWSRRW